MHANLFCITTRAHRIRNSYRRIHGCIAYFVGNHFSFVTRWRERSKHEKRDNWNIWTLVRTKILSKFEGSICREKVSGVFILFYFNFILFLVTINLNTCVPTWKLQTGGGIFVRLKWFHAVLFSLAVPPTFVLHSPALLMVHNRRMRR